MNIEHWNPWRELDGVRALLADRDGSSRFFTRAARSPDESVARSAWLPPVDITETEKAYRIDLEIPAVPVENVEVAVKNGVLTVSGEHQSGTEPEEGRRHRRERRWGRFSRSFRLPESVDENAIEAHARDGVLYLTIAKKEKAQPRRIEVNAA